LSGWRTKQSTSPLAPPNWKVARTAVDNTTIRSIRPDTRLDHSRALATRLCYASSVDQLSAHLDRGWDLAERGDGEGAFACGERAVELDPESPESYNLLGYAAAMVGRPEEAIEYYRQAIGLDETYFEAMLNLSELHIGLGNWEAATEMLGQAQLLTDSDEEACDVILLRCQTLLARGRALEAGQELKKLPKVGITSAHHHFTIGQVHLDLANYPKALEHFQESAKLAPERGDVHYALALCYEHLGDSAECTKELLLARTADANVPEPPWALSSEAFSDLVRTQFAELPSPFRELIASATVYCLDIPGAEVVIDGVDPRAPLLLEGPQEPETTAVRLFLYKRNIERECLNPSELPKVFAELVERELREYLAATHGSMVPEAAHLPN
jgi:tetratricopeptide (TPR) repeat protein